MAIVDSRDRRSHAACTMVPFVKRSLILSASFALAAAAAPARAAGPASPLPALPGSQSSPVDPSAGDASPSNQAASPGVSGTGGVGSPQQVYEHIRRGIVALERNGVPMALGTILDGDGRVLTSLSGLGGADGADIRYADGTSVHAKVGHSEKGSDLALLIPQSGKWTDGLGASETDPVGASLRAILPSHGAHLGPTEAGVKGRVDAHARDGAALSPMLDVDIKGPLIAGAPLLDSTGSVVAVLVRACKGAAPMPDSPAWAAWAAAQEGGAKPAAVACTPAVMGAPVSAIRSFLSKTPAAATTPAPWLGIRGETVAEGSVRGVRVVAVAPSSPAQKASLKPTADIIVAADGQPIDSPEKLADVIGKHSAGDTVKLLVFGDEKFREIPVTLRAAP